MTGLVLKLGPHERVLINGAVIENGDKRSRLAIMTPNANILRLRDAIHPEEVNTPRPPCVLHCTIGFIWRCSGGGCKIATAAGDRAIKPGLDRS